MPTISILHLHKNGAPDAKPGDAATILLYTDSHAATVESVSGSGMTIKVREDRATLASGSEYSGDAQYSYERNPDGRLHTFRFTKRGWIGGGLRALIGTRREYRDPTF